MIGLSGYVFYEEECDWRHPHRSIPLGETHLKELRRLLNLRRADRYTTLTVAAAAGALERAGMQGPLGADCALVTVTAFGPHRTTFAFLDDILDFPEDQVLPTKFSHSVHNAAAAYAGQIFGIGGPTLALTGFENVWREGLQTVSALFESQLCRRALLIGVEERALLTEHVHEFDPGRFAPVHEGAVGLLFSADPSEHRFGRVAFGAAEPDDDALFYFGMPSSTVGALPGVEDAGKNESVVKLGSW